MTFFDGFIRPSLYNAFYGWGKGGNDQRSCRGAGHNMHSLTGRCAPITSGGPFATCVMCPAGLDFVWPFLLRYPVDKIAIVDQASTRPRRSPACWQVLQGTPCRAQGDAQSLRTP